MRLELILLNQDAYVLSALLADPKCNLSSLARIMEIYDQVRRPKSQEVYRPARDIGDVYEFEGSDYEHIKPFDENVGLEELQKIGKATEKHREWMKIPIEEDRENALALLAKA